jgi:hypothetical protein
MWTLLGVAGIAVAWLFAREQGAGRFAPLSVASDETWLREHILKYPAEVIGAAWDEGIGSPEVVALLARMVSEGTLASDVNSKSSMSLRLKVDRNTLSGHERTLVERLFFNGRTHTTTELVKQHYRKKGFNPADEIRPELQTAVGDVMPGGRRPRPLRFVPLVLLIIGIGLLFVDWSRVNIETVTFVVLSIGAVALTSGALAAGRAFRARMHWGRRAAVACLTPALATVAGVSTFLWYYAALDVVEVSTVFVSAIVTLALAVTAAAVDAMMSRQRRAGIAFRKTLAAGRQFFIAELRKAQPALRDEWFPWLMAFGLGPHVDQWSTTRGSADHRVRSSRGSTSSSSSSTSSGGSAWTGFAGGRSGGAGGGASWAAAAGGIAAGVAPPSSSGSSSGGSSGGSSSSSSGSSGGGGGGGW